jgi:hypothetical protein
LFAVVLLIILGVVAVGSLLVAVFGKNLIAVIVAVVAIILGAIVGVTSSFYTQGVGEARVLVNFDGTVAGENIEPGSGWKSPLVHFNKWDLFSQEAAYVGGGDTNYSGGAVNGPQISTAVQNGARVDLDLSVVYSIDAEKVSTLYRQFKTQERFTKQVIETAIRSATRDIPSQYSAVDFRGNKRGEAQTKIGEALKDRLGKYGVNIDVVNLQEIRYSEDVEKSLKAVEVAEQGAKKAEADLRATQISAQAKVVEAQAQADANNLLTKSLSPQILQQRYIDQLGKGTVYVVPEGSTPLVGTSK